MLRLRLDQGCNLRMDFVVSPVWEAIASLSVLARLRLRGAGVYSRWARDAHQNVSPSLVAELWPLVANTTPPPPVNQHVPDFSASFNDERVVELFEDFWCGAFANYWEAMEHSLTSEVRRREEIIAARGWSGALASIDGRLQWRPPLLAAPHQDEIQKTASGAHVQVVPLVFGGAWSLFTALPVGLVSFSYPVPAANALRSPSPALRSPDIQGRGADPLGILLGARRAALLRALHRPATTTSLAAQLGIAASTASEHLQVLLAAGAIRRERQGNEVFYELDHAGFVVLQEFS